MPQRKAKGIEQREKGLIMKSSGAFASRLGIMGDLLLFFWRNKWWWMTPMLLILFGLGGLIVFAKSSAIAPFIYTLF
jgi:hypothetical protein